MDKYLHIKKEDLCLTPRGEKLNSTEKLKRSELEGLDATLWEELCIAASENESTCKDLLNNDEFTHEVEKYMALKLKASSKLYPNKENLKKKSSRVGLWISIAAEGIAILLTITALLQENGNNTANHQVAGTITAPENSRKEQADSINENVHVIQTTPTLAQAESNHANIKPVINSNNASTIQKEDVYVDSSALEQKRTKLNLTAIESTIPSNAIVVAESIKPEIIEADNENVLLFASINELERIEVERPNLLDRLREKSIVSLNRFRGEGTMVVREYDSNGKLTLYAVQSNSLSFEKQYIQ